MFKQTKTTEPRCHTVKMHASVTVTLGLVTTMTSDPENLSAVPTDMINICAKFH